MEDQAASLFIDNIVKNIQTLCHGQVSFNQNVEVIGHLYLNIDSNTKLNYIVNEKCCKINASTTFISNSFHAAPAQAPLLERNKDAITSFSNDLESVSRKQKRSSVKHKRPTKKSKIQFIHSQEDKTTTDRSDEETGIFCGNIEQSDGEHESSIMVEDDGALHVQFSAASSPNSFEETVIKEETIEEPFQIPESIETVASLEDINLLEPSLKKEENVKDIEYTIIEFGTQKGKPLLVDNIGYNYNIRFSRKKNEEENIVWRCTKRNKRLKCSATVIQKGESFVTGSRPHDHDPVPGLLTSSLIYAEVRNQAASDFLTPTSEVVQRAMSVKGLDDDCQHLPKQNNLKRMVNRYRQQKRGVYFLESLMSKQE